MADSTPSLKPGDVVLIAGRHRATVKRVVGDSVDVVETTILGRRATWRIRIDALRLQADERAGAGARGEAL